MSKWLMFSRRGSKECLHLRADIIVSVSPSGNGTMIRLEGDYDGVEVAETPEEVLAMIGVSL